MILVPRSAICSKLVSRLLRRGNGPQVLATLNDLTLGLLAREGHTNAAAGRRIDAAFPDHALNLLIAA